MSATFLWDQVMPRVSLARIAWLRHLIYAFVVFDVLVNVTDPIPHGDVPAELYRPLIVRELLFLPTPTPLYVQVLRVAILVSALVAMTGRAPRLAGWVCAFGMLDWVSNAFSYSKIDHDHFALVVALFVLPTAGRATIRQVEETSRAAGWAVRMIQAAAVSTYFLSALAKFRFGGWGWANGATFIWAFSRRGNWLAQWMAGHPLLVHGSQWLLLGLELASPLLLWLRGRWLALMLGAFLIFHVVTVYLLHIHFLPLVVCLAAFFPLERIGPWWRSRPLSRVASRRRGPGGRPRGESAEPSSAR